MSGYTVKELKKIIVNYKKSNCPAVSRAKRDELLMMIKDLNIDVGKREMKKERVKMNLPKTDKIDLEKFENMEEFPKKKKLIGGDDLLEYTDTATKFMENIKKLYPDEYENLKKELEVLRKQNKKNKSFLNIDDYFKKELNKPIFFNKVFFKKFVKKEGMNYAKTVIMLLFKRVNNKFLSDQIKIPSEELGSDSKGKEIKGNGIDGGLRMSSFGKVYNDKK